MYAQASAAASRLALPGGTSAYYVAMGMAAPVTPALAAVSADAYDVFVITAVNVTGQPATVDLRAGTLVDSAASAPLLALQNALQVPAVAMRSGADEAHALMKAATLAMDAADVAPKVMDLQSWTKLALWFTRHKIAEASAPMLSADDIGRHVLANVLACVTDRSCPEYLTGQEKTAGTALRCNMQNAAWQVVHELAAHFGVSKINTMFARRLTWDSVKALGLILQPAFTDLTDIKVMDGPQIDPNGNGTERLTWSGGPEVTPPAPPPPTQS